MKKLSKIFVLVFAVLCLSVSLVACGPKEGVFSYNTCREKYVAAGYTVTNISIAINDTSRYLELLNIEENLKQEDANKTLPDNLRTEKEALEAKKLYSAGGTMLLTAFNNKDATMELYTKRSQYAYRTSGFIATKKDTDTVVVIQYNTNSTKIKDFDKNLDGRYYSNITKETMKGTSSAPGVYNWGELKSDEE